MRYLAAATILAAIGTARADAPPQRTATSATFALIGPAQADVSVGETFTVAVVATFDERMAACSYRLSAFGAAVSVTARSTTAELRYLGDDPADPLGEGLPVALANGGNLLEVFFNLDQADPPGGPQDGVAPGTDVSLVLYTLRAEQPGTLQLTLSEARAAETQSAPSGKMFDATSVDPARGQVVLTVTGGPDVNADGRVDLRDFARLQACFGAVPAGACTGADIDGDGDVDPRDFVAMQACLAGPADPPACESRSAKGASE